MSSRTKYKLSTALLVLLFLGLTLGYAFLNTTLNINGTTNVHSNSWDVYWDNVQVSNGSVNAETPEIDTDKTTVSFEVDLDKPGDFYEFTVDAKNDGSVDAMIDTITSKLNGVEITTLPAYLEYSVTYDDTQPIAVNHLLTAGSKETILVRIGYKQDITASQMPTSNQTLNLEFTINYIQANSNAIDRTPEPISFSTDSWATIIKAAKNNNLSAYSVGDTKEIDLGTLGVHTLRIANKSTPTECNQEEFSQTACGFVLEFTDIIKLSQMNDTNTNEGGWPVTKIRTEELPIIYNALPQSLQNAIIDSYIKTMPYSSLSSTYYESVDKLYLLSSYEVLGSRASGANLEIPLTRQLDYYAATNAQYSGTSSSIKKYNGTNTTWWFRNAYDGFYNRLFATFYNGGYTLSYCDEAITSNGISPAFRLG